MRVNRTLVSALLVMIALPCALRAGYEEDMARARDLRSGGSPEEAEKIYDAVLAANSRDVDALCGRGFCRLACGKMNDAESDFDRVIELAPDYVDAYVGKAVIRRRQGDNKGSADILGECRVALAGDEGNLRYLAESSWREGHFSFARELDRTYEPESERTLIEEPHAVYLTVTNDWVDGQSDWNSQEITYIKRERPDITWWISAGHYRRYSEDDDEGGVGFSYRHTRDLAFSYSGHFSISDNFLADQKHQPKVEFSPWADTIVGLGVDFSDYDDEWARIGRLELARHIKRLYGKYTLLAGDDANDQSVSTSIFEVGYEREMDWSARLGYATGNESVETGGANEFSEDRIDSLYCSLRYYIRPRWGIIAGYARESRDSDLFRSKGSLSVFTTF